MAFLHRESAWEETSGDEPYVHYSFEEFLTCLSERCEGDAQPDIFGQRFGRGRSQAFIRWRMRRGRKKGRAADTAAAAPGGVRPPKQGPAEPLEADCTTDQAYRSRKPRDVTFQYMHPSIMSLASTIRRAFVSPIALRATSRVFSKAIPDPETAWWLRVTQRFDLDMRDHFGLCGRHYSLPELLSLRKCDLALLLLRRAIKDDGSLLVLDSLFPDLVELQTAEYDKKAKASRSEPKAAVVLQEQIAAAADSIYLLDSPQLLSRD